MAEMIASSSSSARPSFVVESAPPKPGGMSSAPPFAWQLLKVGDDSQGERFTLRFLEFVKPPAVWLGGSREITYEQARDEALARGISTGAFDQAIDRERRRFTPAE